MNLILARTARATPTQAPTAETSTARHHQQPNSARGKGMPSYYQREFDSQSHRTSTPSQRRFDVAQGFMQNQSYQPPMGGLIGMIQQLAAMAQSFLSELAACSGPGMAMGGMPGAQMGSAGGGNTNQPIQYSSSSGYAPQAAHGGGQNTAPGKLVGADGRQWSAGEHETTSDWEHVPQEGGGQRRFIHQPGPEKNDGSGEREPGMMWQHTVDASGKETLHSGWMHDGKEPGNFKRQAYTRGADGKWQGREEKWSPQAHANAAAGKPAGEESASDKRLRSEFPDSKETPGEIRKHLETLKLDPEKATAADAKKAYRTMALKHHPDKALTEKDRDTLSEEQQKKKLGEATVAFQKFGHAHDKLTGK